MSEEEKTQAPAEEPAAGESIEQIAGQDNMDAMLGESPVVNNDTANDSNETQEKQPDTPKIKVGDAEYSEAELSEALRELQNKGTWEKALRQRSQILAHLDDAQIQKIVPYAEGTKEIPNPTSELADQMVQEIMSDELMVIEGTDEDGYATKMKMDEAKFKTIAQKITEQVLSRVQPQLEQAEQAIRTRDEEIAMSATREFMRNHPDYRFSVPNDSNMRTYIQTVLTTGSDHPDYRAVKRLQILTSAMVENNLNTLESAYELIHGADDSNLQKRIIEQQDRIQPAKPGKTIEVSDEDQFLATVADPAENALEKILNAK